MKIIDKALDVELFSIIRKLGCDSQSLPWYLETDISGMGEEENCYFTHLFYNNDTVCSDYMKWGQALKNYLEAKAFIRIKANLYPRTDTIIHHKDHVDYTFEHKAAILYLNTNDGFTVIGDKKIESVANRMILFNHQIPHHSTT